MPPDQRFVLLPGEIAVLVHGEGLFFVAKTGNPGNIYAFGVRSGNGPTVIFHQSGEFSTIKDTSGMINLFDDKGQNPPCCRLAIQNLTSTSQAIMGIIIGDLN